MNIKIITYHAVLNYGAVLQAYALQRYLSNIGNEVAIIDFRRNEDEKAYNILKVPRNIKEGIKLFLNLKYYQQLNSRKKRFTAFLQDNVALTNRYTCLQDFKKNPLQADLFISGSDQVWNCSNGIIPEFFLDFDVDTAKRISYGASIGVDSIPEKYRKIVQQKLSRFDAISVREDDAQKILKTEIGLDAKVVCDPVLLLDRKVWELFIQPKAYIKEKYILCYSLLSNEEVQRCINKVKSKLNYPVYIISGNGYVGLHGDNVIRNAGPIEFLNWIYYAEYVICCSFHGTVFSSIFNKNFVSVVDRNKPSRVMGFLKNIGLSDHIYSEDFNVLTGNNMNADSMEYKLKKLHNSGVEFLEGIMEKSDCRKE